MATVTMPFIAGCTGTGGGGGQQMQDGGTQGETTIIMRQTAFQPSKADVEAGATVEWVNEDSFPHTVTSAQVHDTAASWQFDERVSGGGTVTHTFEDPGVYEYYCTIHGKESMCGAVLVGDAALDASLPCDGGDGGGNAGGGGGGYY